MKYKPYMQYEESGIEWVGEVPKEWKVERMKFSVKINPSKSEISHLDDNVRVSFLPMELISDDGQLTLSETRDLSEVRQGFTYFIDGDVLLAKITPCFENGKGAVCFNLTNEIGFGTTELHVLRPSKRTCSKFLFYITHSLHFRLPGIALMTGAAGQKRVPEDYISNFIIGLPPLPEQHAIAAFLDHETAKIDTLIAKQKQMIALLKEQRQAIITHAVTKGLDADAPMKGSGIEWIGEMPEHWVIKSLKWVARLKSGDSITSENIEDEGDFPVYGGNGLRGFTSSFTHNGYYVLIGRQGALCGNINYAQGYFWASEHAVVVSPKEPVAVIWLGELLRTMNLNQYSISAAQPGLSVDIILNLDILVPPLPEQHAIAAFLNNETAKIDTLITKQEQMIELLKEHRAALITAAVTGKIDVRDYVPDDNSLESEEAVYAR